MPLDYTDSDLLAEARALLGPRRRLLSCCVDCSSTIPTIPPQTRTGPRYPRRPAHFKSVRQCST
jgi:hypothetical protein